MMQPTFIIILQETWKYRNNKPMEVLPWNEQPTTTHKQEQLCIFLYVSEAWYSSKHEAHVVMLIFLFSAQLDDASFGGIVSLVEKTTPIPLPYGSLTTTITNVCSVFLLFYTVCCYYW